MSFKLFLETFDEYSTGNFPWSKKIPPLLQGLAAEARKCTTFEEFKIDFLRQIKHGMYYHLTDNPNFTIDPNKGPRDMSSLASGNMTPNKLMVTSHLANWDDYYDKSRKYVAIIDMSNVPRNTYYQVSRGFGNEFFVSDPRVVKVVTRQQAYRINRDHHKLILKSEEQLRDLYNKAISSSNL